jgi:hypothetical protein
VANKKTDEELDASLRDRLSTHFEIKRVSPTLPTACFVWTGATYTNGYGEVGNCYTHREAYKLWIGPIPPGRLVMHKCDVKACIRPGHLKLGTHKDNTADMIAKGRKVVARGEDHGAAKLTWAEVREIRRLHGEGIRHAEIAKKFDTSPAYVSLIARNGVWRDETYIPVAPRRTGPTKLNAEIVKAIRKDYVDGVKLKEIGKKHAISVKHVHDVARNKNWYDASYAPPRRYQLKQAA